MRFCHVKFVDARGLLKPAGILVIGRVLAGAVALCTTLSACSKTSPVPAVEPQKSAADSFQNDTQKFSYAVGYDVGRSLVHMKGSVDAKSLEQGIEEALAERPARLSDQQRAEIKTTVLRNLQTQQVAAREALAQKNLEDSRKFLDDNAKKSGMRVLSSGLQYEVLSEGSGKHPGPADRAIVNYTGTLIDGSVFDSTAEHHQAATIALAGALPGLREGLLLMSPGSKYRFYIPPQLAYGIASPNSKIGPNSALIYDVEMINVAKSAPTDAAPGTMLHGTKGQS